VYSWHSVHECMSLCFSLIVGDILVLVHASLGGLLGWGAFGIGLGV